MDQNLEKNENYLKTGMFYLGFTDSLYGALENTIRAKEADFSLNETRTFNNKEFDYNLNFKLKDPNGRYPYTLESYNVAFKEDPTHKIEVPLSNNKGITAKESANLLMGLAVGKTTKKANVETMTWTELDFDKKDQNGNLVMNTYGENYGFDMDVALKELEKITPDQQGFSQNDITNLKKGNLPDIVVTVKGKEHAGFLVANPKERAIEVFNDSGELLVKQTGLSEQRQERVEQQARQPLKQAFVMNKLLEKTPRKPIAHLVSEEGERQKKSRKR